MNAILSNIDKILGKHLNNANLFMEQNISRCLFSCDGYRHTNMTNE